LLVLKGKFDDFVKGRKNSTITNKSEEQKSIQQKTFLSQPVTEVVFYEKIHL